MTEEERFQAVKNIYMNYEHELAQRGMENVAPLAVSLTQAYIFHEIAEILKKLPVSINHPYLEESNFPDTLQ